MIKQPLPGGEEKNLLRLRLYIAGDAPNSSLALANLRAILARYQHQGAALEIVDVLKAPGRAMQDRALVTPLLMKLSPAPERKIFGNLNNRDAVILALGLEVKDG